MRHNGFTIRRITDATAPELDTMVRKAMQTVLETAPEFKGREEFAKSAFPNFDFDSMKSMFQEAVVLSTYQFLWVEDEDRRFVGHSIFSIKTESDGRKFCSFYTRYVEPEHRRKGVGERLLSKAEDWSREQGAAYMLAQTHVTNLPLQSLFRKNGFQVFGPDNSGYPHYALRKEVARHGIVELRKPSNELFPSFSEFAEELRQHGEDLWEGYAPKAGEAPGDFVLRQLRRETHPDAPLVPETVYWGISDGHVVGRISLRHELAGNLSKIGGHIGYEVRPSYRRRGIAKEMLRQILLTSKAKEIGKLLLTCSPDNMASNKTILSNGGRFTQKIFVELVNEDRNHYWIDVPRSQGARRPMA